MNDGGIQQLKKAMTLLLDPEQSRRYLLQPSKNDIHVVVPFDGQPREPWIARGNDPAVLADLRAKIEQLNASGGTDIYSAIEKGVATLDAIGPLNDYFPAVIVMTDGMSQGNVGHLHDTLKRRSGVKIPIFSITFGKVDDRQLKPLSEMYQGRVFNGQNDLTKAFRDARGYN
jgi:Ca-activated chloride channel family protein